MAQYQPVSLFGGAITAEFPANFGDVSNIREVPDNQEVYLDNDGFSNIVADILERVDLPDIEALDVHVEEIVQEDTPNMRLVSRETASLPKLPSVQKSPIPFCEVIFTDTKHRPNTPAYTLTTLVPTPANRRGRANEPDFVGILLILIRLVQQGTDLVVSINVPHTPGEYDQGSVDLDSGRLGALMERAGEWRNRVLETLEIKEWGLFGAE